MTAAALVKPVTCSRCKGEGLVTSRVVFAGAPGGCYRCAGAGVVEGDRATLAAAKARNEAVINMSRTTLEALEAAGVKRHQALNVVYGIDHLATNAPDRYERALASFQAGHPGLVRALWAYTAEQGLVHYGTRALTADEAVALLG